MRRLLTKEGRLSCRQAWINGRETIKYKDIEYLLSESQHGGRKTYGLILWRGNAGKPEANYYYYNEAQRNEKINYYKSIADRCEVYKKEQSIKGRYLTEAAKVSNTVKSELKKLYPKINFSVRSQNFAGGDAVHVSWTDGVPDKVIDSIIKKYQYGHFDGMTDMYEYSNKQDFPQVKYISARRDISEAVRDKIKSDLARLAGVSVNEDYMRPKNQCYIYNGENILDFESLNNAIHRISYNYDFSSGFNGARCKKSDNGQDVVNTFELY